MPKKPNHKHAWLGAQVGVIWAVLINHKVQPCVVFAVCVASVTQSVYLSFVSMVIGPFSRYRYLAQLSN